MLDKFGKKVSLSCYFCIEEPESPIHFFSILHKNKFSLDTDTTFFQKCINNASSYTNY